MSNRLPRGAASRASDGWQRTAPVPALLKRMQVRQETINNLFQASVWTVSTSLAATTTPENLLVSICTFSGEAAMCGEM